MAKFKVVRKSGGPDMIEAEKGHVTKEGVLEFRGVAPSVGYEEPLVAAYASGFWESFQAEKA